MLTKLRTPVMPITPPLAAMALIASSVLTRGWSISARQLLCVIEIGFFEISIASSVVRSPLCETSTSMPTAFIASMIETPKSVTPPSTRSVDPDPIRFCEL